MRFVFILTTVLGLLLCNYLYSQTQTTLTTNGRQREKELERNDKDFYDFLKQFKADKNFQNERIIDSSIKTTFEDFLFLRIFYGELEVEEIETEM